MDWSPSCLLEWHCLYLIGWNRDHTKIQDNINVLGLCTCYELLDGTYETISEHSGICRFVWEHCIDSNHIFHWLKHVGATVSAMKLFFCVPEVVIVGQWWTYEGHISDDSKVSKIIHWSPCTSKMEVCSFLGMTSTVHTWIKGYATITHLLT